jgi:hypothetical protein
MYDAPAIYGQEMPIVISADQPNIWTLEQAHYLLAQMHRRNLDLKAASLGELDANAINGLNVDALQTLLSVSAQFDQSVGLNNRFLKDDKMYNATHRRELISRRVSLEDQSLSLTKEIADLKIKQIRAENEDEKKELQSQIDELSVVQTVVKEQLTQTNDELKAAPESKTDFESVDLGEVRTINPDTYNSVFRDTAKKIIEQFNNSPKLNASLRLDNYLQMEYEILSKQLTLLRDEVGPGERLLFMEIPQSINTSHTLANDKWAQSWWKISNYSRCALYDDAKQLLVPCERVLSADDPRPQMSTNEVMSSVRNFNKGKNLSGDYALLNEDEIETKWALESYFREPRSALSTSLYGQLTESSRQRIDHYKENEPLRVDSPEWQHLRADILSVLNRFIQSQIQPSFIPSRSGSNRASSLTESLDPRSTIFRRLYLQKEFGWVKRLNGFSQDVVTLDEAGTGDAPYKDAENRSVRVVDLFPKQSSLNLNDLKMRANSFSARFLFGLLAGWGGGVDYQREHEKYSQFVQQELYSSAFGKGSRQFGWTFNPMPGTNRLLSGVRTTYAIVVVPEEASSVILQSRGCYFPNTSSQPTSFEDNRFSNQQYMNTRYCSNAREFVVTIPEPSKSNAQFKVTAVKYRNVKKGERAVISITGNNFSSQVGVLVNGVPLTQSLGLGQPFIRDDSGVGRDTKTEISIEKVRGSFERIDQTQIVAAFEMDKDYEGTPTITLVAPGTAWELNSQEGLDVNGVITRLSGYYSLSQEKEDLTGQWRAMFGPTKDAIAVEKVTAFASGEKVRVIVTGKNLSVRAVFVNGIATWNSPNPKGSINASHSTGGPIFEDSLILLPGLPLFPKDKTLQVTLLTKEGSINAPAIDNPGAAKEPEAPIKFAFDPEKFTITSRARFESCEENGDTLTAVFAIRGKGLTEKTKAFLIGKDKKEQELEFTYEGSTAGTLIITKPTNRMTVVFKDSGLKLMAQRVITWKKPKTGC